MSYPEITGIGKAERKNTAWFLRCELDSFSVFPCLNLKKKLGRVALLLHDALDEHNTLQLPVNAARQAGDPGV
jgi:hypothetical protein